jgi:hypothetical protein
MESAPGVPATGWIVEAHDDEAAAAGPIPGPSSAVAASGSASQGGSGGGLCRGLPGCRSATAVPRGEIEPTGEG